MPTGRVHPCVLDASAAMAALVPVQATPRAKEERLGPRAYLRPNRGSRTYARSMKVSMDRVGRIVVPKEIRERLGSTANTEFDVTVDGTAIRLQPRIRPARRLRNVDGWPVLPEAPGQVLTDADVQALRDADLR